MTQLREVYLLDAVRTPIGRYGGELAECAPMTGRHCPAWTAGPPSGLDPARLDDVLLGDANGAGEDNRNVARMAVLLARTVSVPAATVNRLCGSGLEAAIGAAGRSRSATRGCAWPAGGVHEPRSVGATQARARVSARPRDAALHTLGWRMVNPQMPPQWTVTLGESARSWPMSTRSAGSPRTSFALRSHQRADAAWRQARFADEVVLVPGTKLDRDEAVRPDASLPALASLATCSVRMGRSPPATPRRCPTVRPHCYWPIGPPPRTSALPRWPGSRPGR